MSGGLQEHLEGLDDELDAGIPLAFTQAVKSFLTALDYDDPALMRSHLNDAREALRDVIREVIAQRLEWPRRAREGCQRVKEKIVGCPRESWDDLGKGLASRFDKRLQSLTDLRDGSVRALQERGYEVENAPQLERAIEELRELKERTLANWPWTDKELPPVDRNMVAESRAALARGEGERIDDLIGRLAGSPARGGEASA
jgi:hypothetical protein